MNLVYFIRSLETDHVKIGISKDPARRVAEMQAHSPVKLRLIGTIPYAKGLEARLHTYFIGFHSHNEWFHLTLHVEREILRLIAGQFDISALPKKAAKAWVHEWRSSGKTHSPNGKPYPVSRPTQSAA